MTKRSTLAALVGLTVVVLAACSSVLDYEDLPPSTTTATTAGGSGGAGAGTGGSGGGGASTGGTGGGVGGSASGICLLNNCSEDGQCAGCGDGRTTCKVEGAALAEGCSACAAAVCMNDPFCCTNSWDAQCVDQATVSANCSC